MEIKVNKVFLALTTDGEPLLCVADKIKDNVAYCTVQNGLWEIGFDMTTLEMCREGTHRFVLQHFDNGYRAKVVLTDLPSGRLADYNERIADALKILEQQKQ